MNYLLYIPGVSGSVGDEHLTNLGLSDLAKDGGPSWREVLRYGPDSESGGPGRGMVATWLRNDPRIDPPEDISQFDWTPSPPCGKVPKAAYWLGIHKEHAPGPADLRRPTQLQGSLVRLADENDWLIPSAIYLPKIYGIDLETGSRSATMDPEFERYSLRAFQYASEFFDKESEIRLLAKAHAGVKLTKDELELASAAGMKADEKTKSVDLENVDPDRLQLTIPLDDGFSHACRALALNYRVNPFILTMLKVLDDRALISICTASVDLPLIQETVKKNAHPSPITVPAGQLI